MCNFALMEWLVVIIVCILAHCIKAVFKHYFMKNKYGWYIDD